MNFNCTFFQRAAHNVTLSSGREVWVSYIVDLDRDDDDGHIIACTDYDSLQVDAELDPDEMDEVRSLI